MAQLKIRELMGKYRYVLLVLLAGIVLMLLPTEPREQDAEAETQASAESETVEQRLESILGRIQGAGKVAVMLTEASAEEVVYQTDGGEAQTVLITDENRNEQGLVRTRHPPVYQGAIVVCQGADSPAVCLAVVEAVANVTGLGSDRITVLKME